jgi:ribose 5-phosphate isomerase B
MMPVLIASDHGGFSLKEKLILFFNKKGIKVKDLGPFDEERCDYPEFAYDLAEKISKGKFKRGILICKSGIGNSIVANRLPGVRAALSSNVKIAKLSRMHNDSNVLVLGSLFVSPDLAKKIAMAWLSTEFEGGRHKRRLMQIREIEKKIRSRR